MPAEAAKTESIWEYKARKGCKCPIEPGMGYFEARALGSGCCTAKGYICPVLDKFRRTQPQPSAEERAADDIATAKLVGLLKPTPIRRS